MNKRKTKKLQKRGGNRNYNSFKNFEKAIDYVDKGKVKNKNLSKVQSAMTSELNKMLSLYEDAGINVPKYIKNQLDEGKDRFDIKSDKKEAKKNIEILKQVYNNSDVASEAKRKDLVEKFKKEVLGTDYIKDGSRRKYQVQGSLFRKDIEKYAENITDVQLLKIYDIIDEMENKKSSLYGQYKSGDFDAMIATASMGYDPTKMSTKDFLNKMDEVKMERERELDKEIIAKGYGKKSIYE